MERKKMPLDIRMQVLHEAAYQCSNPVCRTLITLDIHHIEKISENGITIPENLIALCPNCHRRFHNGEIPIESIRAWKYHLLALNEAYDKKSIDCLLLLNKIGSLFIKSNGLFEIAGLIASGNLEIKEERRETSIEMNYFTGQIKPILENGYCVQLSEKGQALINNWINGNMRNKET